MHYQRTTVTAALPYTNGPVHIGHLAGVYLPADIYCRYLRLRKKDVIFVCGSDENGIPITLKARNEGITPQAVVDKYNAQIRTSFAEFGIAFDIYHRTSSAIHYKTASDIFKAIFDHGGFEEKTSLQYFDQEAGQFLADRYIVGTCPNCGFDRAYGDQCENCGTSLSPDQLINPKSMLSGALPVLKETKHWYLPLNHFQREMEDYILRDHTDWKANVYGQCKSWLDQGLQPRAVTRDLEWGVPVPVTGADGKVLYVWFDAPIGYISATKALEASGRRHGNFQWEQYWKDPETRLIHFIGKDNIVFHCIIFPTILKAYNQSIAVDSTERPFIVADNVPANEFLNLEGEKISTSRNWAVWLHEYLVDFPDKQDVLRYVLCATAPETKDNDFTWKDFQARNNNELVAVLGNFINRVVSLIHQSASGRVPSVGGITASEQNLFDLVRAVPGKVEASIESFRFREALAEIMDLARAGNKYLADTAPWKQKHDPARVNTILNASTQVAINLAILVAPFLPDTAWKIADLFGGRVAGTKDKLEAIESPTGTSWTWADAGRTDFFDFTGQPVLEHFHGVRNPGSLAIGQGLLFEKIEDAPIHAQVEKLTRSKQPSFSASEKTDEFPNEPQKRSLEPIKPGVTFEEFSKMDIRVGTILSAEPVENARKLLKLLIDTGIDQRTVVSGIAEHFDPIKLIGQQVSILVNLAPRKIRGITSNGMILMAENPLEALCFVAPSDRFDDGSVVR